MPAAPGRLFAVVGPSGSGKDTLLDGLVRSRPDIHRACRTVSRPPSEATEGFESGTAAEFARLRDGDAFVLHWPAHGLDYGIRHREFAPLAAGRIVVFNGSRKALPEAMARFPQIGVIVISVSPDILAARLGARGRESAAEIADRLRRPAFDLPAGIDGTVIDNDGAPEEGIARLIAALQPVSA